MKKKGLISISLGLAIASIGTLVCSLPVNAAGTWEKTDDGWKYKKDDGVYACYEYVDGWWINGNEIQSGEQASWHEDSTGWWYGDSTGWYAQNESLIIDGDVYIFNSDGYLETGSGWVKDSKGWRYRRPSDGYYAFAEWVDGYWLDEDGYQRYEYQAQWYQDNKGWFYKDSSGYYIKDSIVSIDGNHYVFDKDGYAVQFTSIKAEKEKMTNIKFEVNTSNKTKAINQINSVMYKLDHNKNAISGVVDGVNTTIRFKNGTTYIGNKKIDDYIKSAPSTIVISFDTTAYDILGWLFVPSDAVDDNYDYKVTFGGITISNIHPSSSEYAKSSFVVNGKEYEYWQLLEGLMIKGDVRKVDWVQTLKKNGLIKDDMTLSYYEGE